MYQLLVNAPDDTQRIEHISSTGEYYDASRVIWDERTDGALPSITLGGMTRVGTDLVFSQPQMDQHNAALLPAIQSIKLAEIQQAYLAAVRADIVYNTFTFAADELAQNLLVSVLSAGSSPVGMYWRDTGGTPRDMDYSDLQSLSSAIVTRGLSLDGTLQTKIAAINIATNQSELDLITWS